MCSTSKVNEALPGVSSFGSSPIPSIPAHKIQKDRSAYFLVDIREPSEVETQAFGDADLHLPMGAICHDAKTKLLEQVGNDKKTIVLVCNSGARAELAAQSIMMQQPSAMVAVLQRGLVGWENIAALVPDFLVVLGIGDSTEKLSLSLAALASAVDQHENVVLVLMSDGVNWFMKPTSSKAVAETPNVETVEHGAPFKPCKAMLNKFLSKGGVILACTTCVKHRGYSFEEDMMDCVNSMQMPDLVRMLGEVKGGSLQFM